MIDKAKAYIVTFCAYGGEPLHILFSALLQDQVCASASSVIPILLELVQDNYLECKLDSSRGNDDYHKVEHLTEMDLIEYVCKHEKQGFYVYPSPEEGGEYFFQTTELGRPFINDDLIFH